MHPMFVKLFLETDAEDPQADGLDRRRRANRARRIRSRATIEVAARDRDRRLWTVTLRPGAPGSTGRSQDRTGRSQRGRPVSVI